MESRNYRDDIWSGAWLTRNRVRDYATILFIVELVTFLFLVAGTHGWITPLVGPTSTDFVSFYAAGQLADAGTPQLAYDVVAHYSAEQQATAAGIAYQFFFYPPVFLPLCMLLARLPYLLAYVTFELVTLVPFLLVMQRILRERGWDILVPLLAFPAIFWNFGLGQNAFMTAALFGGATLLVDRRPLVAGMLFGLLFYKPHLGLLVPVALAAGRNWRAFAGAALSAGGLLLLSVVLFGWDTWRDYLAIALESHSTYESGRIDLSGMISPFAALRLIGVDTVTSYIYQGLANVVAVSLVALTWSRGLSLPIRAASLCAGTLVAVPVLLLYDLMLAAVAGAWLIRAAMEDEWLPGEKMLLAALFLVPLVTRDVGRAWHLPLAAPGLLLLLVLVALRARRELVLQAPANWDYLGVHF
jgi:hypothetical protein